MSQPPTDDRLLELIDSACAGTLDESMHAELDTLLHNNPDACRTYLAHFQLRSDVYLLEGARRAGDNAVLNLAGEVGRAVRDEHLQDERSDPGRGASPTPRPKSLLQRASRHPKGPAFAVAATVLVAALVVMGLVPVKEWVAGGGKAQPEDQEPSEKKEFVARLSNWKNDVWLDDTRPPLDDPRLNIGRRLKIESGLIEVTYLTGARVVIEGPAEFYVGGRDAEGTKAQIDSENLAEDHSRGRKPADAANSGYLALGKLAARIESVKAQGFTIHTPIARIEDLGTEFGVEVDRSGDVEVVVLSGKVDVVRDIDGDSYQQIRVVKDQGAFVAAGTGRITHRSEADAHFIAAMRRRLVVIRDGRLDVDATAGVTLIGHWKFDEESGTTSADSSGRGFHARQTVAAGSWIAGRAGGAYHRPRFALDARHSNIVDLSGRTAVTLSAWVTTSSVTNQFQGIAGFENTGDAQDVYSLKLDNADKVIWTVDGSSSITSPNTLESYAAATDDGWVHLVGVFKQGDASTLYVNGEPVATGGAANRIEHDASLFAIGSYQGASKYVFGGSVDDVQVYYGALSSEDVEFLFNHPGSTIAEKDTSTLDHAGDERTEESRPTRDTEDLSDKTIQDESITEE